MIYNVKIWLEHFNESALIFASKAGNKDIVELLLKQENIDVNIEDVFKI